MVLASPDDWDRHAASQWLNVSDWLAANPDDAEASEEQALAEAYVFVNGGQRGLQVRLARGDAAALLKAVIAPLVA